jgi:predicted Fe-Mo cluster-binding NifX family protein
MKVAVATEGGYVAQHFGRCPEYTIVEVQNNEIIDKKVVPNPGHKPGFLPRYLAERDITCIIAGGMGVRASELFKQHNIETITGVTGPVEDVIQKFISGDLESGPDMCDH